MPDQHPQPWHEQQYIEKVVKSRSGSHTCTCLTSIFLHAAVGPVSVFVTDESVVEHAKAHGLQEAIASTQKSDDEREEAEESVAGLGGGEHACLAIQTARAM